MPSPISWYEPIRTSRFMTGITLLFQQTLTIDLQGLLTTIYDVGRYDLKIDYTQNA
ncbi:MULTISPECIES: hypothetical protein [unclassified Okeania]|uniref:hypothetical protein n=1 Tax=unclassified Okeania TaxID=2634635 RepID=UPI0013C1A47A|nr:MULTISPECIES: hypothetical protein [unclassified Okeania]NET24190.1 hypothetical protein [Okeania sp. SIO1I7]NET41576.1 hypothetical protein [Okeania sp. SIO2B3]